MTLELDVFRKMSQEEITEYGKTIPYGYTYDKNGYVLTYKDSYGFWGEFTRGENGNILTHKNSSGYWHEFTRDEKGNLLNYKNSNGA